jgi:hypothetical protein
LAAVSSLSRTRAPISMAFRTVSPAELLALADQMGRALVLHRERLDDDLVVERADGAVAGRLAELKLWFLRGFHVDSRR